MHNITAESLIQLVSLTVVFFFFSQHYNLFGEKYLHDNPKNAGGEGGEQLINKVLYGEAPPQCPTPLPFYIPFLTEKVLLFVYLLLTKWYPVHIP